MDASTKAAIGLTQSVRLDDVHPATNRAIVELNRMMAVDPELNFLKIAEFLIVKIADEHRANAELMDLGDAHQLGQPERH